MEFNFDSPILNGSQTILPVKDALSHIKPLLAEKGAHRPFVVCGNSARSLDRWGELTSNCECWTFFSDFAPNPDYQSTAAGARLFRASGSDFLISIGGGSAIDVAKTIKLFAAMEGEGNYLDMPHVHSDVPHLAIPTTAGTGSESTKFSVIYYQGVKQSIEDECIRPDFVFLDGDLLKTLPIYQRKCALFDAMGQCIESVWSKGATGESTQYAQEGLKTILGSFDAYLGGDSAAAREILLGANLSGRAINISKTTAAHAMSYGISAACRIPHGHAVALALPAVWSMLIRRSEEDKALDAVLGHITGCFGLSRHSDALDAYLRLFETAGLSVPELPAETLDALVHTVNLQRLGNTPADLSQQELVGLYHHTFRV